jgi:1-deoxy-D-xylulose-5-phosphate synthase
VGRLDEIRGPEDIRGYTRDELKALARELRDRHIDVVSNHGGHFGASLGVADLTVALHYVFDTPRDQLVWDTGHQGYIHKILTGRNEAFPTIRQYGGLSPFLRRDESEFDTFGAGHAATSISAALGMAAARDILGTDEKVIAIIGDGSMGCGLAYEALNNAGHTDRDLIVILNDNEMSIAPNVGAMSRYLNSVLNNPVYDRVRDQIKSLLRKGPRTVTGIMESVILRVEDSVKHLLVPGMLFEELGFRYVGPVDGHDMDALIDTLERVKRMNGPVLLHAVTQKGKGYSPAEADPVKWHASGPFDKVSGNGPRKVAGLPRYQEVFGIGVTELGRENDRVAVITAGMPGGTSSEVFERAFPTRHFDVGIAEGHAVTFAAGLATRGVRPVVAIYSTFLQRAYDNIVHDVALQGLPVVFCMDRGGIAGEDGPTHHGALDLAYMLSIPGMTVTAPCDGSEMLALLRHGVEEAEGPLSLRYPRDTVPAEVPALSEIPKIRGASWEIVRSGAGADVAVLAVGTMVGMAEKAAKTLAEEAGIEVTVVNCRFLKPYDRECLGRILVEYPCVLTLEEGTVANGFGAFLLREIHDDPGLPVPAIMETHGLPDDYVTHGPRGTLLRDVGLDSAGIQARIRAMIGRWEAAQATAPEAAGDRARAQAHIPEGT